MLGSGRSAADPIAALASIAQRKEQPAQEAMLQAHALIERVMLGALGSFATLMAIRLSLISDIDLATKWMLAIMAGLVVLTVILGRFRSTTAEGS